MSVQSIARFRDLFAQEAEVRLARLGQLLLQVERDGADLDTIGEIFREVHTLKGAAAVVGFDELSRFTHGVEETLEELRSGRVALTPALVDALLTSVDGIGKLSAASLDGRDGTELAAIVAGLERAEAPDHGAVADPPIVVEVVQAVEVVEVVPTPAPVTKARATRTAVSRGAILVPVERLEDLVRLVGEAASAHLRVERMVHQRLGIATAGDTELSELSRLLNDLQDKAMRTQMVPVATITDQLQRAVRDLARDLGKDIRWEVEGEQTELERNVLHELADALLHTVRNAVDHGIETPEERLRVGKTAHGTVRLHAAQLGSEVIISVSDDGRGIDVAAVRTKAIAHGVDTEGLSDDEALQLVFHSGLSTARALTHISGRGVGLDVVQASLEAARGRVEIQSEPGAGTVLRLVVPITLAVLPCLLVEAAGQRFALPLHRVVVVHESQVATSHGEGRVVLWVDGDAVPVTALGDALGRSGRSTGPIVVVNGTRQRHAFQVDALVGQRDCVVKGLSAVLARIDVVAGTSIEPDGSVLVLLDPPGLVERARHVGPRHVPTTVAGAVTAPRHILVVDDALTVREVQRSILERAGFAVSVAGDGLEGLARLTEGGIDLVLTDVEMPRMDGFALTRAIRARPEQANLPVLIVTTLDSAAHRQEGLDAGADGYIVKAGFDEHALLDAVGRVLGRDP